MELYAQKQEKKTKPSKTGSRDKNPSNNMILFSPHSRNRPIIQMSQKDNLELKKLLQEFCKEIEDLIRPLMVDYKEGLAEYTELDKAGSPSEDSYDILVNQWNLLNRQKALLTSKETNEELDTQYEQLDSIFHDIDDEYYEMLDRVVSFAEKYQVQQDASNQLRPVLQQAQYALAARLSQDKEYPHTLQQKEEWLAKYHELNDRTPEAVSLIIACNQSVFELNESLQEYNAFMNTINEKMQEILQQLKTLVEQHKQYLAERQELRAQVTKEHSALLSAEEHRLNEIREIKDTRKALRQKISDLNSLKISAQKRIDSKKEKHANPKTHTLSDSDLIILCEQEIAKIEQQITGLRQHKQQNRGPGGSTRELRATKFEFNHGTTSAIREEWYKGYEVQHLIPFSIAIRLGLPFDFINGPLNLMMLPRGRGDLVDPQGVPQTVSEERKTHAARRPLHIISGRNHPKYNAAVLSFITLKYPEMFEDIASEEKRKIATSIAYILREVAKEYKSPRHVDDITCTKILSVHKEFIQYRQSGGSKFPDYVISLSGSGKNNMAQYEVEVAQDYF